MGIVKKGLNKRGVSEKQTIPLDEITLQQKGKKTTLEALNMMQLHVSVEKRMFRVKQRQKAYEHQGGKQACLDHDAEVQPYIRSCCHFPNCIHFRHFSKCFREIIGFVKGD